MPRPSRSSTRSGCTRPLGRHGGLGWDRLSDRRHPTSCLHASTCVHPPRPLLNLHRQVGSGSTPPSSWAHSSRACCLLAFSVKQLCNSAAPTPQCRHPTSCLCASSSTFNLHRQVCPGSTPPSSWCNVGAGLGTEQTSVSERPPSHAVVDILFLSGFCRHSYCLALDTTHPSNRDTRQNVATTRQPYAPFFMFF